MIAKKLIDLYHDESGATANLKDLFTAVAEELGDAAKVLKEED